MIPLILNPLTLDIPCPDKILVVIKEIEQLDNKTIPTFIGTAIADDMFPLYADEEDEEFEDENSPEGESFQNDNSSEDEREDAGSPEDERFDPE
jgi:hypothetical protein